MFSASDGLFHFVFANQEGEYITPSLLKLKFLPYMQLQIIESGFQYIYTIKRMQYSDESYAMQSVGSKSISFIKEDKKRKKGLFSIFSGKEESPSAQNYDAAVSEINLDEMKERILQILELMQTQREIALALPFSVFNDIGRNEKIEPVLKKIAKNNKGNIIVLFGSLYKDENDVFFRRTELEKLNGIVSDSSVFFNKELFPEISDLFPGRMVNKVFSNRIAYYRLLRKKLGSRMQVWNEFTYDEISNAVRYKFIHEDTIPFDKISLADKYSQFLCMWYNDPSFNDRYNNLTVNDNPQRSVTEFVKYLDSEENRRRIEEIIADNFIYNDDNFFSGCIMTDNGSDRAFVDILTEYRNILRNNDNVLNDDELKQLFEITDFFREPAFIHYKNSQMPTYINFIENKNIFEEFFKFLKNKNRNEGWNRWDVSMAYIIYAIISYCYEDALNDCDKNMYHIDSKDALKKSIEVLEIIKKKSISAPFADEEAARYTNSFIECLNTKDSNKIRYFR